MWRVPPRFQKHMVSFAVVSAHQACVPGTFLLDYLKTVHSFCEVPIFRDILPSLSKVALTNREQIFVESPWNSSSSPAFYDSHPILVGFIVRLLKTSKYQRTESTILTSVLIKPI